MDFTVCHFPSCGTKSFIGVTSIEIKTNLELQKQILQKKYVYVISAWNSTFKYCFGVEKST